MAKMDLNKSKPQYAPKSLKAVPILMMPGFAAMTTSQPSPFLTKLPRELRNKIYRYVVVFDLTLQPNSYKEFFPKNPNI